MAPKWISETTEVRMDVLNGFNEQGPRPEGAGTGPEGREREIDNKKRIPRKGKKSIQSILGPSLGGVWGKPSLGGVGGGKAENSKHARTHKGNAVSVASTHECY